MTQRLADTDGPVVAVSDYLRAVQDQIRPFVPGDFMSLGTDGWGLSDTRGALRRHFLVDAEAITVQALAMLGAAGQGRSGRSGCGGCPVPPQRPGGRGRGEHRGQRLTQAVGGTWARAPAHDGEQYRLDRRSCGGFRLPGAVSGAARLAPWPAVGRRSGWSSSHAWVLPRTASNDVGTFRAVKSLHHSTRGSHGRLPLGPSGTSSRAEKERRSLALVSHWLLRPLPGPESRAKALATTPGPAPWPHPTGLPGHPGGRRVRSTAALAPAPRCRRSARGRTR